MISKPIVVVLFSGVTVAVALSSACGGSTVAEGTGASTGTGGTTTSSTHSATVSSSSSSSASSSSTASSSSGGVDASTSLACGTATCASNDVDGFVTLQPCCPSDTNSCGYDLTPLAALLPFAAGCMELMRPGTPDTSCPSKTISVMNTMVTLPGCCATNTGICGATTDFTSFAPGLDFGCADTSGFADAGPPQSCQQGSDGGTTDAAAASDAASDAEAASDAAADAADGG